MSRVSRFKIETALLNFSHGEVVEAGNQLLGQFCPFLDSERRRFSSDGHGFYGRNGSADDRR
jgi:hypothetical protein